MLPLRWSACTRTKLSKLVCNLQGHRYATTLKGAPIPPRHPFSSTTHRPSAQPNPDEVAISLRSYQSPFYKAPNHHPSSVSPDPIANAASAFHPHVIRAYRDFKSIRSESSIKTDPLIESMYLSTQDMLVFMSKRMHKMHLYSRYLQNHATKVLYASHLITSSAIIPEIPDSYVSSS